MVLLGLWTAALHHHLVANEQYYQLDAFTGETDGFRCLNFGEKGLSAVYEFAKSQGEDPYEVLAVWMITNDYDLKGAKEMSPSFFQENLSGLLKWKEIPFRKVVNSYRTLLSDLVYFPVPENTKGEGGVSYENTWGMERTYGGERSHEGTDIWLWKRKEDTIRW